MTTIDKLDISVYNLYAIRTKMMEQFETQIQMTKASAIPTHTQVADNYPKPTEIDLLLGVRTAHTPWATFQPPKEFRLLRRSPFKRHRIAPSFEKEQDGMEEFLNSYDEKDEEEKEEKETLQECFNQMGTINKWMGEILGNIGRFVQG